MYGIIKIYFWNSNNYLEGELFMIDINWKRFELKNPKATEAFETLCYFLFCRKYKVTDGIRTDFNQVGLETEPIKDKEGKYCGFQSKYFEKSINYKNIADSIGNALDHYDELNHIIIYVNQQAQTSCKSAKEIERKCSEKGVTVEWFLPGEFLSSLNQPENLDLAEFYFGETDVLKWTSDSKSLRINTLLQAKEYIELNLKNKDTTVTVSQYAEVILSSEDKLHLFSGAAGSGKSVCLRKLFNIYGGFDCSSEAEQLEAINKLEAICIFVNLNRVSLNSLENIVSSYRSTYSMNSQNNNIIYLFDGLDEIPSNSIAPTLLYIEELLEKTTTKKVVISCRLSSYNKFMLKANFQNIIEYTIEDLSEEQIQTYFSDKEDDEKINKLNELCDKKEAFCKNITDVLTLTLLWKHILHLTNINVLPELMEISVSTILKDIHHKKYLDAIKLPNPKEKAIIEINKNLAFYLFEKDTFCVTQEELYEIIEGAYPKCDYESVNQIASFMADNFFDVVITDDIYTFSYRHRRFSEYFTLLCIDSKIQKDLNYLREKNIIINRDLFDDMLIPYLQNKAMKSKNLALAFQVGLFNVYMGNDKAWGVDNSFYYWTKWIIYSVAALPETIFQSVVEDKSLPIHSFFVDIPKKIITILEESKKPSFNMDFQQYYMNYILLIALMHKFGKVQFLPEQLLKYEEIRKLNREKKYYFNSTSNRDNFLVWNSIFYIDTVIYNDRVDDIIKSLVEHSKEVNLDGMLKDYISTDIFLLSALYYNLILYYPEKCMNTIKTLNLNQMSLFVFALSKPECINAIYRNDEMKNALIEKLEEEIDTEGLSVVLCLAMKKRIGCSLSERENAIISKFFKGTEFRSHTIFWKEYCDMVGFIFTAFQEKIDLLQLDTAVTQYITVYDTYMKLLSEECTISRFIGRIKMYLNSNTEANYYIRILLGKVLAVCDADDFSIKGAIDYINYAMKDGGLLVVYHTMKLYNPERFNRMISASIISKLNTPKMYQDIDYTSTSDSLFILSFITSAHNEWNSYALLLNGISNGLMRMNERKDTIGDYRLLECLEEMLKKNWLLTKQLNGYLDRVILIANKMNMFHIENDVHGQVIEMLIKYDFEAAEYYYNRVVTLEETYNKIHFDFALGLVGRGRDVELIESCLNNLTTYFDRYWEKLESESFYYKISIYLRIAVCDFYSASVQDRYFEKACEVINELEAAGWERKLNVADYDIYTKLCNKRQKEIDVIKEKIPEYSVKSREQKNDTLKILNEIDTAEELITFIPKLQREYSIDTFEVNEMLIQKSIDLMGNIEDIVKMLSDSYYPSSVSGTLNGRNFWMTVVSALRHPRSKSEMLDYLIKSGGHDGFSELIKICGELNNKDICLEAFDTMIKCIEFLLC